MRCDALLWEEGERCIRTAGRSQAVPSTVQDSGSQTEAAEGDVVGGPVLGIDDHNPMDYCVDIVTCRGRPSY